MEPTRDRSGLVGVAGAVLFLLVAVGLVVGYVWSVVNGEAAVVTAATALLVFGAGEVLTRRRVAQQYRWDKIAPSYEAFIRLVRELAKEDDDPTGGSRTAEILGEFGDKLLLWGSPGVVEAWSGAMRLTETDPPARDMVAAYARVLLAIRKDLGHTDWTLETRDLLRVTITDIDEYLSAGTRL